MQVEENKLEFHKMYYCFAFDETTTYELKFRTDKQVTCSFLHSWLMIEHGIDASARCQLELSFKNKPHEKLEWKSLIDIGSTLLVRRVPIKNYTNALQKIIDCYAQKDSSKLNLEVDLGISREELEQIITDNTQTTMKQLIEDLKQRFMIQDEINDASYQSQQNNVMPRLQGVRAVKAQKSKKNNVDNEIQSESDESSEEPVNRNANDTLKLLDKTDDVVGQWFRSGKIFKK